MLKRADAADGKRHGGNAHFLHWPRITKQLRGYTCIKQTNAAAAAVLLSQSALEKRTKTNAHTQNLQI